MSAEGYVETYDGTKLYYEIVGKGEPLVMINDGPGFPHTHLHETRALAKYAKLVYYDQRGCGKSSKADPKTYTIQTNGEDIEILRRRLGLGKISIFGHSWGGMLAQVYALKYQDNLGKLVLADTFSSIDQIIGILNRLYRSVSPRAKAIYEKYEREGLYKGGDRYPEEYAKAAELAYESVLIGVPAPKYLRNIFSQVSTDVYRAMWGEESEFKITGSMLEFNVLSRLGEIKVPVLVIIGAHDMPTMAHAEALATGVQNGRLEIFKKTRHYPFIEEKDKFVKVVSEFLSE